MRPVLVATLAALAAAPAAAERRQFGNVIYELPPDWSQGRSDRGEQVLLFDGDEEVCPYCSLHIGAGGPAEGDLAAWLRARSMDFVDEDDRGSVQVVSEPEALSDGDRRLAMMGQRVGSDIQVLFAIDAGDRFELIGFEGWAYDQEEIARSLSYFQDNVTPMVLSMAYASEGAEGLLPEAVPGSLDGLWWGWNQGFTMGLDMMMTPTMEYRTIAFWPDGRFYDGTPPTGLEPLDPASLGADVSWGTYREAGGEIGLTFADGRTERLLPEDGGFSDGTRVLRRVKTLPDGAPLDGTIASVTYIPLGPAGSDMSGSFSGSRSTTFHPDGTYEGTSFGAAVGTFSDAGTTTGGYAVGGDRAPTGGTYEVRDGLMVMSPADGSAPQASLAFRTQGGELMIGDEFLEPG